MAHILLAEDDDSLRGFLARALEKAGHSVVACENGDDAIDALDMGPYDLLLGTAAAASFAAHGSTGGSPDAPPSASKLLKLLRFGAKSHPEAAAFSPDGSTLATGSADGFIELWHATSHSSNPNASSGSGSSSSSSSSSNLLGTLRTDLGFQKEEQFMMHDSAILSLAFSADSALLASGDKEGCVKVWRASTGQCLRRPSSKAAKRSGSEVGVWSSFLTCTCARLAPASKAACVDSTCSAMVMGTAGLCSLRGTDPVMATVMMHGLVIA